MSFADIKKSIVPIRVDTKIPITSWEAKNIAGSRTTYSRRYWRAASSQPVGGGWIQYNDIYCNQHHRRELVPNETYYDGLLYLWYDAGLHPRYSIWDAIIERYPRFPRSALGLVAKDKMNEMLVKYQRSPAKLADAIEAIRKENANVRMTLGGRNWSVPRQFRQRIRDKSFTIQDWLNERNQTFRRLILLSRSFTIEEVTKSMSVLAKDEEGEILLDVGGQNYLHVVCPTTGEHYLLGIPPRPICIHGVSVIAERGWARIEHEVEHDLRSPWERQFGCNPVPNKTGWTPASARRWTFGLPDDAQFIQEA